MQFDFDIKELIGFPQKKIEEELTRLFLKEAGDSQEQILIGKTPYAITLAGEQISYNGGCVLMSAINKHIFIAARKNKTKTFSFVNLNTQENEEFDFANPPSASIQAEILFAMIELLLEKGYKIDSGFDILVLSTIDVKSLNYTTFEVAAISVIFDLFKLNAEKKELAEICADAEKKVLNTKYGWAEQFCILNLQTSRQAIFFDTKYLNYEYIPFDLNEYKILLLFTAESDELRENSVSNIRRVECEEGIRVLQKKIDIDKLCEITQADYDYFKINFFDETIKHRVKHCVSENARVHKTIAALKEKDMDLFGKLLCEAHISLRDNFEIVTKKQNLLVESAIIQCGCRGAKMTGYDFSGAAIALVKEADIANFTKEVNDSYYEKTESVPLICVGD